TIVTLALLVSLGTGAMAEPQGSDTTQVAANKTTRVGAPKKTGRASAPNVMRGADNITLVGRRPWWRSERMQTIRYLDKTVASQVLTAADSWLGLEPDGIQDAMEDDGFGGPSGAAAAYRDRYVVVGPPGMAIDESVGVGSGAANEAASPD